MLELLIIVSMNIDAALLLMGLGKPYDLELNYTSRLITKYFARLLPSSEGRSSSRSSREHRAASRSAAEGQRDGTGPFVPRAKRDRSSSRSSSLIVHPASRARRDWA